MTQPTVKFVSMVETEKHRTYMTYTLMDEDCTKLLSQNRNNVNQKFKYQFGFSKCVNCIQ